MASSTKDSSQYQLQTDARIKLILHNDTLFTPPNKLPLWGRVTDL